MKTLIIYASIHHDNTMKVADAMAKELDATLMKAQEASPEAMASYDVIGIGSGIYMGKFHNTALKLIGDNGWEGKKVFVFSTSGMGSDRFNAPVVEALAAKGSDVIGSWTCKGFDTYVKFFNLFGGLAKGHPDEQDLQSAREFAKSMGEIAK